MLRSGLVRFGWNSRSGSFKRREVFGLMTTKRTSSFFFLDLFLCFPAMDFLTPSHKIFREAIPFLLTRSVGVDTLLLIYTEGGEEVRIRLNANVDEEQTKRLKHALVDEGLSFSEWLRRRIDAYLKEKEPKRQTKSKPRKGA